MRFKICGIRSEREIADAVIGGADALGFIVNDGIQTDGQPLEELRDLRQQVPPLVSTVLVTAMTSVSDIIPLQAQMNCDTIQFARTLKQKVVQQLRDAIPQARLLQVVYVRGPESLRDALQAQERGVDAVTLDTPGISDQVRSLGGTGRTHDWTASASIRTRLSIPVVLAGGLSPSNVRQAIDVVQPFAVDVSSGVRSPDGELLANRVAAFCRP